jgi:hypothetical protein
VVAGGCRGGQVEPKFSSALHGKITRGGQPLQVDKARHGGYANVELVFVPLDRAGRQFTTKAGEDGAFEVLLPEGQTIPPGKYRIAVHQWNPQPKTDELGGRFSEQNSPIVRDITGGQQELVIDLASPKG